MFNGHSDTVQTVTETGEIQNQYDYGIFGSPTLTIETAACSIRYAGEYLDNETGLYYLRARYYDPYIGRFISEDSFWGEYNNPLSLNLYTYTYNNPISYVDPTGNIVTKWDEALLTPMELEILAELTKCWEDANLAGDEALKNIAHKEAENIREKYRKSTELGSNDGYTYDMNENNTATINSLDSGATKKTSSSGYIPKKEKTIVQILQEDTAMSKTMEFNPLSRQIIKSNGEFVQVMPSKSSLSEDANFFQKAFDWLQSNDNQYDMGRFVAYVEGYQILSNSGTINDIKRKLKVLRKEYGFFNIPGYASELIELYDWYDKYSETGEPAAYEPDLVINSIPYSLREADYSKLKSDDLFIQIAKDKIAYDDFIMEWTKIIGNMSGGIQNKGFTGGESRTIGNTKIGKQQVRVDIEYPSGKSTGNLHIQTKGAGEKTKVFIEKLEDLEKLPKSIRNNLSIIKWIKKGLELLEKLRR